MDLAEQAFSALGLTCKRTGKGGLLIFLDQAAARPTRALTAHVDTLGAMVCALKENGRLGLTPIGGLPAHAAEGAYVRIYSEGQTYTGTILSTRASSHVFGPKAHELERTFPNLEVRVDAKADGKDDLAALGIGVGDFIALEPHPVTERGYIKARFLDDKAGVACLYGAARRLSDEGLTPAAPSVLFLSCYEEVGHGCPAGLPEVDELVAVDMAAVGPGQASHERAVTICAKDATGPYDLPLRRRLAGLARTSGIDYVVDTYPFYASDASQAHRAGRDVRTGLIGPGVDASHAYERVHERSLAQTERLIVAYLLEA